MGFLSNVGKAFKGVVHGVGKVFKKAFQTVGKLLNSKLGKVIMLAAMVVGVGAALYAGYTAAMSAGGTFMNSFVAGAKAFGTALMHPVQNIKDIIGKAGVFAEGAGAAGQVGKVTQAAEAASNLESVAGAGGDVVTSNPNTLVNLEGAGGGNMTTLPGSAPQGLGGPGGGSLGIDATNPIQAALDGTSESLIKTGTNLASDTAKLAADTSSFIEPIVDKTPGLLSQAGDLAVDLGKKAYNFSTSSGGGLMLGQAAMGYAEGKSNERIWDRKVSNDKWWDKQWHDGESNALSGINHSLTAPITGNSGGAKQTTSRRSRFTPTVGYGGNT